MMTKYDLEPIVKTYYDALEEGDILGRKCTRCGHIEFPPYLCCNSCGCLDTKWVNLNHVRGVVKQALPTVGAFGDPDFRKAHGDYWAVEVVIPGADPVNTSLLHIDPEKYTEFTEKIRREDVYVRPLIIQDEDTKVLVWELEGDSEFKKIPVIETLVIKETAEEKAPAEEPASAKQVATETAGDAADDPVAQTVIACAAAAYGVDASAITLSTDIREDLSNESLKMIVMISSIEDELDATIEIQEASQLNTIQDFVEKVKEKME